MVLTLRNCPPFTPVNSHADAQKSSGAFFRGWCGERCRKRLSGRRNALRASQQLQTTDVMVNPADWQVQKKPSRAFLYLIDMHTLQPSGLPADFTRSQLLFSGLPLFPCHFLSQNQPGKLKRCARQIRRLPQCPVVHCAFWRLPELHLSKPLRKILDR